MRKAGRAHQNQRVIVREPDVLARTHGHAPGDVQRVLACAEHAREPVQRRVGLAAAHALVQCRDEVVVRVARAVVARRDGVAERGEQRGLGRRWSGDQDQFKERERGAGVACGERGEACEDARGELGIGRKWRRGQGGRCALRRGIRL